MIDELNSLQSARLGNPAERIFREQWERMQGYATANFPEDGGGSRLLDNILGRRSDSRDEYVAAAMIQWLGTPVGKSFLDMTERAYRQATRNRREAEKEFAALFLHGQSKATPMESELADDIASRVAKPGSKEHRTIRERLTAAMRVCTRKLKRRNRPAPDPRSTRLIQIEDDEHEAEQTGPVVRR